MLRARTDIRLVQLLGADGTRPYDFVASGDARTYNDLLTAAGLDFINDYAAGIGPARDLLIPRPENVLGAATTVVADAHPAGLLVHAYTFRAENAFLSAAHRKGADPAAYGDYEGETRRYLRLGIDGFFTDQPDFGIRALAAGAIPGPRSLGAEASGGRAVAVARRQDSGCGVRVRRASNGRRRVAPAPRP